MKIPDAFLQQKQENQKLRKCFSLYNTDFRKSDRMVILLIQKNLFKIKYYSRQEIAFLTIIKPLPVSFF